MEPVSANTLPSNYTLFLNVVSYPSRFIGSKSESLYSFTARLLTGEQRGTGYHFVPQKDLNSQEAKSYLSYAVLAASAFSLHPDWLNLIEYEVISPIELELNLNALPGSIHANHSRFFDATTGLRVTIFAKESEIIIGFGPAGSYETEIADLYERAKVGTYIWCCGVMANLAGMIPFIYTQAEALVTRILQMPVCQNKKILLVGHSIGGSIASYIALKHQIKAIGFNSLPLGAGLQKDIGEDRLAFAEQYTTHLSVSWDIPSDCPGFHYLDRCISFAGIKTPGNFGHHFRIPSNRWSQSEIHNEYLKAIIDIAGQKESKNLYEVIPLLK